jgi:SpoVK/Ycf46/Vps4 family AAA+-type ATPase
LYDISLFTLLAKEASLGPVRCIDILTVKASDIRAISSDDFVNALKVIRPSVTPESLVEFEEWNQLYGTRG